MVSKHHRALRKMPGSRTRIAVNIPVKVSGTDIEGHAILADGMAINMSRGGACLRLGTETPLGAIVAIHWQDERGSHEARACLRWKQQQDEQWQVGVEVIDNPSLWAKLFHLIYDRSTLR